MKKKYLLMMLIAVSAIVGCGQTVDEVVAEIDSRSEALVYFSETDSPVTGVRSSGKAAPFLTPVTFVRAMRLPSAIAVEERDWDAKFDWLEKQDAAWASLRVYMEETLTDRHFYVTGDIQKQVWFVGMYQGQVVGCMAYAIET